MVSSETDRKKAKVDWGYLVQKNKTGMKNEVDFLIQNGFQESRGWLTTLTEKQFKELRKGKEKLRS